MYLRTQAKQFAAALRICGERVTFIIDGKRCSKRAVVQNAGKNFMRKYDDDENVMRLLGRSRQRDKIMFFSYFDSFNTTDRDIFVQWRDKRYVVVADSVLQLGDEPFAIWALLSECNNPKEGYYGDNIE